MKKLILSFLLLAFNLFPQANLDFEFDYAQFGFDSTSNYVEFYYAYNQSTMEVKSTETGNMVEAKLKISIEDTASNEMIVDKEYFVSHNVQEALMNQSLVGVIGFVLPEGDFKLEITGTDANDTDNYKTIIDYISINPLIRDSMTVSDIQLASKMIKDSENSNSIFYKNTYEVMPIPNLVFGEEQPAMFYYSELYNLDVDPTSPPLKLLEILYGSRGNVVAQKTKYLSRKVGSRVEVGSFILSDLPTDSYTLNLSIIDSASNYGVSSSKRFFVYNPSVEYIDTLQQMGTSVLSSPFGALSVEELDDLFLKLRYIASNPEIDKYERLDTEEGKREFMYEFWKARDPDPDTPQNEYYFEYLRRIEESNAKFNSLTKKGWKTDRGRVLMIYGEPTEIERYPNELETRPYEIWQYTDIEGGVFFVFADLSGFSEYLLIHSTKRGELRDANWGRRIIIQ